MSSTVLILSSTCWMRPTSVLVCRLRTLLRRIAVNMLQISAWHVTSQWDNSSTMQPMLSASWMMKFISRSNSPPTSYKRRRRRRRMKDKVFGNMGNWKEKGKEKENRKEKWFTEAFVLWSLGEERLPPWRMLIMDRKEFPCWRPHITQQIIILYLCTHAERHRKPSSLPSLFPSVPFEVQHSPIATAIILTMRPTKNPYRSTVRWWLTNLSVPGIWKTISQRSPFLQSRVQRLGLFLMTAL